MTKSTIQGKVIGLVFSTILGVTMAGSAMANCSGKQLVSDCTQAQGNCSNSYENIGGQPYQCAKMQSGKAAGLCGAGIICPSK
jgi:hypothetical protein